VIQDRHERDADAVTRGSDPASEVLITQPVADGTPVPDSTECRCRQHADIRARAGLFAADWATLCVVVQRAALPRMSCSAPRGRPRGRRSSDTLDSSVRSCDLGGQKKVVHLVC